MFKGVVLLLITCLLTSCASMALAESPKPGSGTDNHLYFNQWDVPHTNLTMLLPEGWVTDYYQGDIAIASDSQNFFYSPERQFEGVLIHMFLSDGPRAIGPTFDVLNLAKDYVADQPNVRQAPTLIEQDGRQIVTTYYENEDDKGKLITYLAGFVVEDQQLTVFLAATPSDTERIFLPVLEIMLRSILIKSSL
jgi:hypothetical protein